jgi:hypothetical protein
MGRYVPLAWAVYDMLPTQPAKVHWRHASEEEHTMKQQLRALAAAALLTVTMGSPHAFANDGKSYAGATCQPAYRADVDKIAYTAGRAWNTSTTSDLVLQCPVLKDTAHGIDGAGIAIVNRNNHLECTLRSYDVPDGAEPVEIDNVRVATGFDPDVQRVHFAHGLTTSRYGYYTMDCVVPPVTSAGMSGVVFYWLEEQD